MGTNNKEARIKRRVYELCSLRPHTYGELSRATGSPVSSLHVQVHRWVRDGWLHRINPRTTNVMLEVV